jgi:hypothetical protein
MADLQRLIASLERALAAPDQEQYNYIKAIKDPELLIIALNELHRMIGNDSVKNNIAMQTSSLIRDQKKRVGNNGKPSMLHTVIFGPPGVGKTNIGVKLAKIWYSLGLLEKKKSNGRGLGGVPGIAREGGTDLTVGGMSMMDLYWILLIVVILWYILAGPVKGAYNFLGAKLFFGIILILVIVGIVYWMSFRSWESEGRGARNAKPAPCPPGKVCKETKPVIIDDDLIKVAGRTDLISEFLGGSAKKTKAFLTEHLGKVVFIDEAHSLLTGPWDPYGKEALTELNRFMSERAGEIVVVIAGYKHLLQPGIFTAEPGFHRRFIWQFECEGYTIEELFQIFEIQARAQEWELVRRDEIIELFQQNDDTFPSYGGDTERLITYCKFLHNQAMIDGGLTREGELTPEIVEAGINKLRENNIHDSDDHRGDNQDRDQFDIQDIINMTRRSKKDKPAHRVRKAPKAPPKAPEQNDDPESEDLSPPLGGPIPPFTGDKGCDNACNGDVCSPLNLNVLPGQEGIHHSQVVPRY